MFISLLKYGNGYKINCYYSNFQAKNFYKKIFHKNFSIKKMNGNKKKKTFQPLI